MKTEAIRLCIQAQHGKQDYAEARKELNALLARLEELEAAQQSVHADAGESAASSELFQASAESTSQTVTQTTQRGLRKPLGVYLQKRRKNATR